LQGNIKKNLTPKPNLWECWIATFRQGTIMKTYVHYFRPQNGYGNEITVLAQN